jgi:hypothetical protein
MDENRQNWISIAVVVVVVVALGFFLFRQSRESEEPVIETEEQVAEERADEFLEQIEVTLPEDADRANLRDVASTNSVGVATRRGEEGQTEYSVLASLPDPERSQHYEAYLVDDAGEQTFLGRLVQGKGGWMVDYRSMKEIEADKVVVSREEDVDGEPDEVILEGEFSGTGGQ